MKIEYLFGVTYRITPEKGDAGFPAPQRGAELNRLLRRASDRIEQECGVYIPVSSMDAERLLRSDGSSVIIMRQEEPRCEPLFFACDIEGNSEIGALCRALSAAGELSENTRFFLAEGEAWRVILKDPTEQAEHICREFGDWCEISGLFAAQTAERLVEAARGEEIALLGAALY